MNFLRNSIWLKTLFRTYRLKYEERSEGISPESAARMEMKYETNYFIFIRLFQKGFGYVVEFYLFLHVIGLLMTTRIILTPLPISELQIST